MSGLRMCGASQRARDERKRERNQSIVQCCSTAVLYCTVLYCNIVLLQSCVGVAFLVDRSQCQKRAPGAVSPWRARTVDGVLVRVRW